MSIFTRRPVQLQEVFERYMGLLGVEIEAATELCQRAGSIEEFFKLLDDGRRFGFPEQEVRDPEAGRKDYAAGYVPGPEPEPVERVGLYHPEQPVYDAHRYGWRAPSLDSNVRGPEAALVVGPPIGYNPDQSAPWDGRLEISSGAQPWTEAFPPPIPPPDPAYLAMRAELQRQADATWK
jgi:hypothetical protein